MSSLDLDDEDLATPKKKTVYEEMMEMKKKEKQKSRMRQLKLKANPDRLSKIELELTYESITPKEANKKIK